MTSLTMGFFMYINQDYRTRHEIPSCGVDLKSNQKVLSYPQQPCHYYTSRHIVPGSHY